MKRVRPGTLSFTKHPLFAVLSPYMYLDPTGARGNVRIQLRRRKMPYGVRSQAAQLTMPCVACGEQMHPLRNGKYFAAACPLTKNISCSRTANASIEYWTVRKALACPTAQATAN